MWALLSTDAQSLGSFLFLPLPFGLKGYWLFLLALFLLLFSHILLFLASRINLMIFQILNNISPFPSFFQEPTILTFLKQQIQKTYALFKHSFRKQKVLSPHQTNSTSFRDEFEILYFLFFCD